MNEHKKRHGFLLTKERTKFLLRRVILPVFLIHVGLGVIATVRNSFVKSKDYGAVLISDYAVTRFDYWASPLAFFGAYPYWTYYFNNRGMKARWFLRAKSTDLARVIKDSACQSIVLVGHGSFNAWQATNMVVTNAEVEKMMEGARKKRGEWLQLTCGVEDTFPVKMGELVMDKERVYTYNDSVNTYIFVTDALFGFKYIKSLNRVALQGA